MLQIDAQVIEDKIGFFSSENILNIGIIAMDITNTICIRFQNLFRCIHHMLIYIDTDQFYILRQRQKRRCMSAMSKRTIDDKLAFRVQK